MAQDICKKTAWDKSSIYFFSSGRKDLYRLFLACFKDVANAPEDFWRMCPNDENKKRKHVLRERGEDSRVYQHRRHKETSRNCNSRSQAHEYEI